jgi:hypothetical protein
MTFEEIHDKLNTTEVWKRLQEYQSKKVFQNIPDFDKIAKIVENVRGSDDYQMMQDYLIETTSSCDLKEAINWMTFFMVDAIQQGKGIPDNFLRNQFLAAFDLWKELFSN